MEIDGNFQNKIADAINETKDLSTEAKTLALLLAKVPVIKFGGYGPVEFKTETILDALVAQFAVDMFQTEAAKPDVIKGINLQTVRGALKLIGHKDTVSNASLLCVLLDIATEKYSIE